MKAMILAAGRGERMRPLTDIDPKPLLQAGGRSLIEHQIIKLRDAGISDIVINTAWLAEKIQSKLGDGSPLGVSISYSHETQALETAGGIINALPLLDNAPFLLINADAWCDIDLSVVTQLNLGNALARLVLVDTPDYLNGDFALQDSLIQHKSSGLLPLYTYSGIALMHPKLFAGLSPGKRPLLPVFENCMAQQKLHGQYYNGDWMDIGTPQRLQFLQNKLAR